MKYISLEEAELVKSDKSESNKGCLFYDSGNKVFYTDEFFNKYCVGVGDSELLPIIKSMLSSDYRVRLKSELDLTLYRLNKLNKYLAKLPEGISNEEYILLSRQSDTMGEYYQILKKRLEQYEE